MEQSIRSDETKNYRFELDSVMSGYEQMETNEKEVERSQISVHSLKQNGNR